MNYYLTPKEIQERVDNIITEIKHNNFFNDLDEIDIQIKMHDPWDIEFYRQKQDEINLIMNKVTEYYYEVRALIETYISKRAFELSAEFEADKQIVVSGKVMKFSRVPGTTTLESAAKSEISKAQWAEVVLKGWRNRAENAIKTARNHTYGGDSDKENN